MGAGLFNILIGAGVALVLLGTGKKTAPAAPPAKQPPVWPPCPPEGTRLLLVGDSLSVGLAPRLKAAAQGCGTHFDADDRGGTNIAGWSKWIVGDLAKYQPTAVLVSVGGNDFYREDTQKLRSQIDEFVAAVRGSGARLLYISPPAFTALTDKAGVRQMWAQTWAQAPQFDMFLTEQIDIPLSGDGIHPTGAGYDMLAQLLWEWTSNTLR